MSFTEKYLNAKELSATLGVGLSTVYGLFSREDFPATRIGKRIVVSETALREWMNNGGTQKRKV